MSEDITLKIIILGASTVGKTSIFIRYFDDEFSHSTITTVGVDFKTKFFKFEGTKIRINFIDTAGQEKFKAISQNYLKGTDGVIFVFDLTNRETLELVDFWAECINKNTRENIGKILFGNKKDKIKNREIDFNEGKALGDKIGCPYYEGSALTGENIDFIMNEIAKSSYIEWKKTEENSDTVRLPSVVLEQKIKKKKSCCKGK